MPRRLVVRLLSAFNPGIGADLAAADLTGLVLVFVIAGGEATLHAATARRQRKRLDPGPSLDRSTSVRMGGRTGRVAPDHRSDIARPIGDDVARFLGCRFLPGYRDLHAPPGAATPPTGSETAPGPATRLAARWGPSRGRPP